MKTPNFLKMNMKSSSVWLLIGALLLPACKMAAQTNFFWTGTNAALSLGGDNVLQNTNNWNPCIPGLPTAASANGANPNNGCIIVFNGSPAGPLFLTNMTQNTGSWDANDGIKIGLTALQTSPVTIVQSNTFTGRIRLGPTNAINVASGAGALTFGNGISGNFPLALGAINGGGNGVVCDVTNNSTSAVTFNSEVTWVMGGGGSHPFQCNGTGDWIFNTSVQANNSGASMSLVVAGPGRVILNGTTPLNTPAGNTANITLAGGTLILGGANALAGSATFVITGGALDSSVPNLTMSSANSESWNGDFAFTGSQNLNLGFGVITLNASRTVTVNASTLEVDGGIAGVGDSLTKAGAGKLVLGGFNTYSNGTIISGGVLQLAPGNSGGFPSTGTAVGESLTNNGTMDLNGNSITVSSLVGSGVVDTTGGSVTLTVGDQNANGSFSGAIQNTSGSLSLIKSGTGSLTLGGASTYTGGTAVSAGAVLVTNVSGSATGSGAVTVNSGATFGGSGIVSGPVTWQSGSFGAFTVGSPLTVSGSVGLNGNVLVINVPGATPLGVGNYTLMTYNNAGSSGSFSTAIPSFTGAGTAAGTTIAVTNGNGVVSLVVGTTISGLTATWTNNGNGNWSTGANWSSNPQIPHKAGDAATFGVGSTFTTVTLDTPITNAAVQFSNTNSFSIANVGNIFTFDNTNAGAALIVVSGSSNSIAAPVSLNDNLSVPVFAGASMAISNTISNGKGTHVMTVSGSGILSLLGNNSYGPAAGSVGTTILGNNTLNLGNNNALSTGDVSIGGAITVIALTPLTIANNLLDTNNVGLNDNGNNVTLSGNISGTGGLAKAGAGVTILSGANSYNGTTSMGGGGTIQLGNASGIPGGTGDGPVNMGTNTTLDLHGFSPTLDSINATPTSATIDNLSATPATLTVGASGGFGTFSGSVKNSSGSLALVMNGAGQQTLAGINTYSGGTTISQGTLQLGSGLTNGLDVGVGTGPVVDNGILQFNLVGTNAFTNSISGSGVVNLNNNNLMLVLSNANTFTGNVNVNGGALYLKNGNSLGIGPKQVFVSNGTAGNSQLYLDGSAGNVTTPAGVDFQLSNLNGCLFNVAGSNTITGNIYMPFGGGAAYVVVNSGFLTLAGNVADGGTFNNSRTLQLGGSGNGLFSGTANDNGYNGNAIALGTITKTDSGTWTISGTNITDGTLDANGGMLVLSGQWTTGPAVVNSGGTLSGNGSASNLTVNAGGKFVPGAYGSVGSFTVSNFLTLSGATYVSINKSLAQSNTVLYISSTNVVANSGSSLIVSNLGPALAVGDTFYLFSEAVTNGGSSMTIIAPVGVAFTNNLAVNGSITVIPSTATSPTNITAVVQGNQLILSWPSDHTGWSLQSQTNSLSKGLATNWVTIPGSSAYNSYTNTINRANGTVFYRMIYP